MAVPHAGRLQQFAPPTEGRDRPASLFVNGFVGQASRMAGTMDAGGAVQARAAALPPGSRVVVCLRPEHLRFVPDGSRDRCWHAVGYLT